MAQISTLDDRLERLTNTADSSDYSDSQKQDDLTRAAHQLITRIKQAEDSWDFQGEIATTDLSAVTSRSDREYLFPDDILQIKRVEIDFDGDGDFTRVSWIDSSEVSTSIGSNDEIEDEFSNSSPYVELFDEGFFVYSGSIDSTVSNGVKIWYSEEIVGEDSTGNDIASFSADTDKPKINEGFQDALVYGAAKIYAQGQGNSDKVNYFYQEYERIAKQAEKWYSNRAPDAPLIVQGAHDLSDFE